jgi:hypothetical protein
MNSNYSLGEQLLIFHLRPARRKAREAAEAEALSLLQDLSPQAPRGGPLSEQGGLFWLALPTQSLGIARDRLPLLGYTSAVDLVEPLSDGWPTRDQAVVSQTRITRWRGKQWQLVRVYEEDPVAVREQAPDRRVFLFETSQGEVRQIRGYRGDGRPGSRRGLPVYDARLLTNLVFTPETGVLLDPFAGAGGIVVAALNNGWQIVSSDIDPSLRYGLSYLGALHVVADARYMPFATASISAIATEPPYEKPAGEIVFGALREMHRVLNGGGRIAILCASWQRQGLRIEGAALNLRLCLDTPIDRKGLDVALLAWEKEK